MAREKVFSYVKDDDKIPIQKLSLLDQIIVLFKKLTFDSSAELKREDLLTRETLKLKADLSNFLIGATESIRNGEHKSVHVKVSSKFNPVLDEVINSGRFANYYNIRIQSPYMEYDIEHFNDVWMEVKG